MPRLIGSKLFSIFLSAIFALATAAIGPMHGASAIPDAQLQAFITSGGTAAEICGDMVHGPTTASACAFCLSPTGWLLPDIARATLTVPRIFEASFTADAENGTIRDVRDPALGLRAPPLPI